MTLAAKPTHAITRIAFTALLTALCPLLAAADSKMAADPFAGAFFSPELVLLSRDRIALTPEQREALHAHVEKTKPVSDELRRSWKPKPLRWRRLRNRIAWMKPRLVCSSTKSSMSSARRSIFTLGCCWRSRIC